MEIGIIGNGNIAAALGAGWIAAGHTLSIGGRTPERAQALATRLGPAARAVTPREAAEHGEVVLLAVRWEDVEVALALAGAADGTLAGTPLIDCSNAVDHGVGTLLTPPGEAAAERIAALAPGAQVVKAFHLFPAAQWSREARSVQVPARLTQSAAPTTQTAARLTQSAAPTTQTAARP